MAPRSERKPLSYYLGLNYPFQAVADPDGGWVVLFPDLPGCITQGDTLEELTSMAREAMELWIEGVYERGGDIPLPTYYDPQTDFSGRFNLRVPKSLHRDLAESAQRDGVSLNQYVVSLLSRRDAEAGLEKRVEALERAQAPAAARVADERPLYAAKRAKTKRTTATRTRKRT